MKKHLLLFSMLLFSVLGYAQTAQLLVAHNSPDAALSEADIYIVFDDGSGGTITISEQDVEFRNAVPIQEVTAGEIITVYLAPSNSSSKDDAVYSQEIGPLNDGDVYIAVANGILTTSTGYTDNPSFNIDVYTTGRTEASTAGNTDVLFINGAPGVPSLDLSVAGATTSLIGAEINYSEFSDYSELLSSDNTILTVVDHTSGDVLVSYIFPLDGYEQTNEAGVLIASGFADPSSNNDGPSVALFYIPMTGGPFYELPEYTAPTSFIQVIHGSADDAVSTVDIYVGAEGNMVKYNDISFLNATDFFEIPSGVDSYIIIAPSTSFSEVDAADDAYLIKSIGSLDDYVAYVAVLYGIKSSSTGYSPAPALDINIYDNAEIFANDEENVDILFFNAATDAPAVDLNDQVAATTFIDGVSYGNFSDYLELSYQNYVLDVADDATDDVIASYNAPLVISNLQGYALTVVAVGFIDPSANNDGLAFSLFAATPEGGELFALPLDVTTNVNQMTEAQMSVFPVPATDAVTVSLDNAGTVEIFSAQGEVVMTSSVNSGNNNLNVSALKPGMYTLRVTSADKVGVRKIVVAK